MPGRGRPKKRNSSANFNSKKEAVGKPSVSTSIELIVVDDHENPAMIPQIRSNRRQNDFPLGMRNEGVSVCFFNSVSQVLYSQHPFRN